MTIPEEKLKQLGQKLNLLKDENQPNFKNHSFNSNSKQNINQEINSTFKNPENINLMNFSEDKNIALKSTANKNINQTFQKTHNSEKNTHFEIFEIKNLPQISENFYEQNDEFLSKHDFENLIAEMTKQFDPNFLKNDFDFQYSGINC